MKRLYHAIVLLLAIHFIALASCVAYLVREGRLDREKVLAIRDILYPAEKATPATQPVAIAPASQPVMKLEELLAKYAGRPPTEQLEYIRHSFDSHVAQLDRGQRDLQHLRQQVDLAQQQLARDRAALDAERGKLEAQKREADRLATDKGFQDSLALYETLPAKQVKTVFMGLDDATVIRYLQAMESRTAAKITKEFKSQPEVERLKTILEKMRQASAAVSVKE